MQDGVRWLEERRFSIVCVDGASQGLIQVGCSIIGAILLQTLLNPELSSVMSRRERRLDYKMHVHHAPNRTLARLLAWNNAGVRPSDD